MVSRIRAYIRENRMIEPKDRVLAGLSGGADSVCLLFVLLELRRELDFELFCVHVNHNLRGDEAFVRELCRAQGVPLVCRSCRVRERAEEEGRSLEEMGRICRYEAFGEIAGEQGCSRIAVAHHADDQAETMLFHLFRGTGIRGLSGMRPVRGKVIRPLLILESKEIREWLAERGIAWCTDSTNQSEDYTRNLIEAVPGRMKPHGFALCPGAGESGGGAAYGRDGPGALGNRRFPGRENGGGLPALCPAGG